MKFVIVLALCAAAAVAAPADSKNAETLRYNFDNIGVEGYNYDVETSDGKSAKETGQLVNPGTDGEKLVVQGEFSYTAPDGQLIRVTYTADEFGFRASGAHLPV